MSNEGVTKVKSELMSNGFYSPFVSGLSERKIFEFPGVCYQCNFDIQAYSDLDAIHLINRDLTKHFHQAVAKRKSEFVAGRYLAKKALRALGSDKTNVEVGRNREPLWPSPFIGSISHTSDFAICAVASQCSVKRIGLDVELVMDADLAKDIADSILVEPEYKFVSSSLAPNPLVLTLIFSAKESLFKALYPEVGYYFGFDAAQIKDIDFHTGKFTLELVQSLTPTLLSGESFKGSFELQSRQVITMLVC